MVIRGPAELSVRVIPLISSITRDTNPENGSLQRTVSAILEQVNRSFQVHCARHSLCFVWQCNSVRGQLVFSARNPSFRSANFIQLHLIRPNFFTLLQELLLLLSFLLLVLSFSCLSRTPFYLAPSFPRVHPNFIFLFPS